MHVTQETDQNYGLFKSQLRKNIQTLMAFQQNAFIQQQQLHEHLPDEHPSPFPVVSLGTVNNDFSHRRVLANYDRGDDDIYLQEDVSMDSTLDAKLDYERRATTFGISLTEYHADNGRFVDAAWHDSCHALQQSFQFCGVGSHHQNGIAERRIRDLLDAARASLLHAIQHWPDGVTKNLWPFALKHACNIRNKVRSKDGRTPEEIFVGIPSSSYVDLTQFHPFGCPVYVLDARLQNGNKIPRWEPRTRVGVYRGHSPYHAQSVALILNLSTGMFRHSII